MEKRKLNDVEGKILEAISTGTYDEVCALLKEPGVRIHCLDETGMTFLQHAAFRGKTQLCELFVAHGCDVNSNHHDNSYSTLTFAAISGNVETTRLILEAGANINYENNLGRTATQMAAFVGQHACVTLINNFIPISQLEYYTQPQGLEGEGKLPADLLKPLYTLMNMGNIHPVGITKYLDKHRDLLAERCKVTKVLDLICEKCMKSRETNDVMALKSHYMSAIITRAGKTLDEKGDLNSWIKILVRGRESDGIQENIELFIRGCLQEFPYMESQLLQQLVRQLAPVKLGNDPTALSMLMSSINGQQFFKDEDKACATCGTKNSPKKCSACKMVSYCNAECQKLHWATHKHFCKHLATQFVKLEEEQARLAELEKEKAEKERLTEVKRKNEENEKETNKTDCTEKTCDDDDIGHDQEMTKKIENLEIHPDCDKEVDKCCV